MGQDDTFSVSEMERRKRQMSGGRSEAAPPGRSRPGSGGGPVAPYPPGGGDAYYYEETPPSMRDNINVRHYWDVVKRRWLVVALCVITVTAISVGPERNQVVTR